MRQFEFRLLEALGYGVDFDHDHQGRQLQADGYYSFHCDQGLVATQPSPDELSFSGECLLAIGRGDFSKPLYLRSAKHLARTVLQPHLGKKPLQSRALFRPRQQD